MALVIPIAQGILTATSAKRIEGEEFFPRCTSGPSVNPGACNIFNSSFRRKYSVNSIEVRNSFGVERRRSRLANSTEKQEGRNFRKLPKLLEFSGGARMQLLRSPGCSSSTSFPVFSGSSGFSVQKLSWTVRFRRQRPGEVAALASGPSVESEDVGDEGRDDVEVREIIDVSNGAEAKDAKVEAEIKYKEDYRKFRESLEVKRKRFWHNLKEQHQVYKADREEWGIGLNPIFTVYEDTAGKCYKVDVDEDEVSLRSGVDPQFPQFADDEARELVEKRIAKANSLARDIVEGDYEPNELSILFKFQKEGQETTIGSVRGNGDKELIPPNFLPTPLQKINLGTIFVFCVIGGFSYKWWSERKTKSTNPVVDEQELRLMKMRKLKAKMNAKQVIENPEVIEEDIRKKGGDGGSSKRETEAKHAVVDVTPDKGIGIKSGIEDEKFQKKVEKIRAMARQVRLQEKNADAQNLERSQRKRSAEEEPKKKIRSKELESLAKNLDDVRRLGLENEESTAMNFEGTTSNVNLGSPGKPLNGKPPTVQQDRTSTPGDQRSSAADRLSTPESTLPTNEEKRPPAQSSPGVKPRIILSPNDARASIAAKKARLESGDSSTVPRKSGFGADELKAKIKSKRTKAAADSVNGTLKEAVNGALRDASSQSSQGTSSGSSQVALSPSVGGSLGQRTAGGQVSRLTLEGAPAEPSGEKDAGIAAGEDVLKTSVQGVTDQQMPQAKEEEGTAEKTGEKKISIPSKEEEEEQEWMRDDVLRDIVFKVQANEEAGREPFFGLNSEEEKRFFRGLERKFEREGDRVKTWIKDRVENIDYGADGVSIHDPPEAYTMKWKEGMEPSSKASELSKRFSEDRKRLLQKQSGLTYTSSEPSDDEDDKDDVQPVQPSSYSSKTSPSLSPKPESSNIGEVKTKEIISKGGKTIVTSSPRPDPFNPDISRNGKTEEEPAESWQNTKRWSKDLERKYELEKNPETRAFMREMGQDLDRWITEEEIEEASRLLEKGVEGENEYVRMHYEKTRAKIKQQREMFGREAMMEKYGEYKPEQEEPELWWFDLPYVLCLGLQSTIDGEVRSGLYSVDVGAALEGVRDTSDMVHTVAFQDRGDAHNFSRLLQHESAKLGADGVEVIPFEPKELYRDAKAEGYKVTVIKKGQLQLSIDQPLEEVESRIMEIGSAKYFDELIRDRSVDIDSVIDEGLGYGQKP